MSLKAALTPGDTSAIAVRGLVEKQSWAASAVPSLCCHPSGHNTQGASAQLNQLSRVGAGAASLVSSSFVWLCSSCAPLKKPQGEKGRAAAPLIPAKLSGCLLLALCYASTVPSLPKATALWCRQIRLGWICLWCAYHKVCHHLRELGRLIVEKKPSDFDSVCQITAAFTPLILLLFNIRGLLLSSADIHTPTIHLTLI